MSVEGLLVVATVASAVAAVASLAVTWLGLRESRRAAEEHRRRSRHDKDAELQDRLSPLYPGMRRVLGSLDDGVPLEIREALVPFFVLYSDAFAAHRDGLLDDRDWHGFSTELLNWAQKPNARRAWAAFRQQEWTEGFIEYLDDALDGPPAYPRLQCNSHPPEVHWEPSQTETASSDRVESPAL